MIRITAVQLTPNPVDAGTQYAVRVQTEEYTLAEVRLYEAGGRTLCDTGGAALYAKNTDPASAGYTSAYTGGQIDALITAMLG